MGTSSSRPSNPPASPPPSPPSCTPAVGTPVVEGTAVPAPPAPAAEGRQKLDIVFTMDCTGSMGSYIQAAKQNIAAIARRLAGAEGYDVRFGLVAYRDHPPQDQTFVTRSFAFVTAVSEMQANLKTLSAQGGGDGPEAVGAALKATLEQSWRADATKICILIADAPPHGLGESGDGFPNGAPDGVDPLHVLDQMSTSGICVYSVGCQPALSHYRYATDFFIAAAERTNGQSVALGSAAALADVIMGGAIEEMDLEKLTKDMQAQVLRMQQEAPEMEEEEVQRRVYEGMAAKGQRTRQLRQERLKSKHSALVSEAASLSAACAALRSAAPDDDDDEEDYEEDELCSSGMADAYAPDSMYVLRSAGGAMRKPTMRMKAGKRSLAGGPSLAAAPQPASSSVELEEGDITYEQVSRLYGRCKKKGLW